MTVSAVALLCASASFAEETTTETTTTTAGQPAQSTTTAATTQTTSAPYAAGTSDRVSERTVERRPNRTLLSTGAGVFLLSYLPSVIAAGVSDRDADKKMFIPVAGPWMDLADRGCTAASPCGSNEDVAKAMILTSGIVQAAGILMALGSFIIPESTTIEDRSTTAKVAPKPKITVAPVSYVAGAGLGAVATF
jgi:hypothetical protein